MHKLYFILKPSLPKALLDGLKLDCFQGSINKACLDRSCELDTRTLSCWDNVAKTERFSWTVEEVKWFAKFKWWPELIWTLRDAAGRHSTGLICSLHSTSLASCVQRLTVPLNTPCAHVAKGSSIWFCPSVCLSVCLSSEKNWNLNIDRVKRFPKLIVTLKL